MCAANDGKAQNKISVLIPFKAICRHSSTLIKLAVVFVGCWIVVTRHFCDHESPSHNTARSLHQHTVAKPSSKDVPLKVTPYDFRSSPMATQFKVVKVDCSKIIQGDNNEIEKAEAITKTDMPVPRDDFGYYMELRGGCESFIADQGYIMTPLTTDEKDFPIAMSLLFFKDFHQVEELFRTVYRPQNSYCLYVDPKAKNHVFEAARLLAECFDNVVIPRDLVRVENSNLITPEIVCMYELLKSKNWKYYINMIGQEFPIKTNRQIVQILRALNGNNDVKVLSKRHQDQTFANRFSKSRKPPHGIRLLRGEPHIVASRAFVEFATTDTRVRDLVNYLNGTYAAEEAFWGSLNSDPKLNAPGGFKGSPTKAMTLSSIGRVKWRISDGHKCSGKYDGTCVYGVKNLQQIVADDAILAHKFHWQVQPMARLCIREWLYNRTRDEYM